MNKHYYFTFFMLLLSALGHAQVHRLVFEVQDRRTARPVEHAIIDITYKSGQQSFETLSDGRCIVILEDEFGEIDDDENLVITVRREGYESKTDRRRVPNSANTIVYEIQKTPIRITGIVTDDIDGSLLEEVNIFLNGKQTETDAAGYYSIEIPFYKIQEDNNRLNFALKKKGYKDKVVRLKIELDDIEKRSKTIDFEISDSNKKGVAFKTTTIGSRLWTSKALSIEVEDSDCYDNPNCEEQGRLYTWKAAKEACTKLGDGWRLPTVADWGHLLEELGEGYGFAGAGKKAKGNPKKSFEKLRKNENFNLHLRGYGRGDKIYEVGKTAYYWTADDARKAHDAQAFSVHKSGIYLETKSKSFYFSCACIKN